MWFGALCAGVVAIAVGLWFCAATLLRPGGHDGAQAPGRAIAAAWVGLIDGRLWATAADAQAARLGDATAVVNRTEAGAHLRAMLRRSLSLAPLQPRLWMLLAQSEGGILAVKSQVDALEMVYATGPNRVDLVVPRLRLSSGLPGFGSRTVRDFALADVAFLLSSPGGRQALLAIYRGAGAENRPFLYDAIASRDPALAATLTGVPGQP